MEVNGCWGLIPPNVWWTVSGGLVLWGNCDWWLFRATSFDCGGDPGDFAFAYCGGCDRLLFVYPPTLNMVYWIIVPSQMIEQNAMQQR